MTEQEIQQRIRLACSRGEARLFRNNVALGWVGKHQQITPANAFTIAQTLKPGDVVIRNARPLHAGLCKGSSDLIGWRSVVITPDMVGQTVAVFSALEVKSARGSPTDEQLNFLGTVQRFGGISGIARCEDDAKLLLRLDP